MLLPPIEAIHVGEKFTNAALHQERSSLWNVGTSVMGTESVQPGGPGNGLAFHGDGYLDLRRRAGDLLQAGFSK